MIAVIAGSVVGLLVLAATVILTAGGLVARVIKGDVRKSVQNLARLR